MPAGPDLALGPALEFPPGPEEAPSGSRWALFLSGLVRRKLALASAVYLVLLVAGTVIVPQVTGYGADDIDLAATLAPPSGAHPLGTDENGRDILTRLFVGGQVSLTIGFVAMIVAVGLGTLIGGLAGYIGGASETLLMAFTDAFLAIPIFFITMTVLTLFGSTVPNIVLVIGLTGWMIVARVVRSEVLRIKHYEYVIAAAALGASRRRIFVKHILPQAFPLIVVAAALSLAWAILVETSLSYLGLGVQPPDPSWGNMLANAQQYVFSAPMLAVYPGVLILLTVLAFNYLGSVLRDVLEVGSVEPS
ncbi:MAG TPA: ABC transporter permease [Solirubrobacteraceae bacterium]|nr:ABC transporter permease [Solirubrobacteraceae bacterium]